LSRRIGRSQNGVAGGSSGPLDREPPPESAGSAGGLASRWPARPGRLRWTRLNWTRLNWTRLNWTRLNWTRVRRNWTGGERDG
jgi:hypothetical protein